MSFQLLCVILTTLCIYIYIYTYLVAKTRKFCENKVFNIVNVEHRSIKCFCNKRYRNETELSNYFWNLKEKEVEHIITWEKLRHSNTCLRQSGLCNFCLDETPGSLLSHAKPFIQQIRRREVSTCRHVSTPTSSSPTVVAKTTLPNRPPHPSEDHRSHRRI